MKFRIRCFPVRILPLVLSLLAASRPGEARNPAAEEKKLAQRVDQFYKLFVTGDWGKVEPFVSPDTREIWLAAPKNKLNSYHVESVKIAPDGKQATATVSVVSPVARIPGLPLQQTQNSEWVNQKGQWYIKLKRAPSLMELFKRMHPPADVASTQPPLIFEQNPVKIPASDSAAEVVVKVPYQSITGYGITISDLGTSCACLSAKVDRSTLQLGDKGSLTLRYHPSANVPTQNAMTVHATVAPLMYPLNLSVVITSGK